MVEKKTIFIILSRVIRSVNMLNGRQIKLLDYLKINQRWRTGKEIAAYLKVSDRTVRSDVNLINKNYEKSVICSDRHKGYILQDGVFDTLELPKQMEGIPQTPEDRVMYIIRKLLLSNKEINLSNLENEIFVSDSSLETDIRRVKKSTSGECKIKTKILFI